MPAPFDVIDGDDPGTTLDRFDRAGNLYLKGQLFVGGIQTPSQSPVVSASVVPLMGPGIDLTGASDSTTAMQAVIDAAPNGATIVANGRYTFRAITISGGKTLKGSGFSWFLDGVHLYGDTNWSNANLFNGTIFRSTATSGTAITVRDQLNQEQLSYYQL